MPAIKKRKKAKKVARRVRRPRREIPKLPTERSEIEKDPSKYLVLIYGLEKVGKSLSASNWPDALFLTCEPGTKGLRIFQKEIESWEDILGMVAALENEPERFRTIVIDTVDRAYDMCLAHTCDQLGIPYPGEKDTGKRDYGKSWRDVRVAFTDVVERIVRTGRGIIFISHVRAVEITERYGTTYHRVGPSMSNQAAGVVEALVDIILYATYLKDKRGNTIRVFICQGDENVWAGFREPADFPQILPMVKGRAYEVFCQGFRGEHPGLDPKLLRPVQDAPKPTKDLLHTMARKGAKKTAKPKKVSRPARRKPPTRL